MKDSAVRPPLRRDQQQVTRQRLMDAAMTSFRMNGYDRTTINHIVAEAGTGRATFYLHFTGKAEVLLEGWREQQQPQMTELFAKLDSLEALTRDSLTEWFSEMFDFWDKNRTMAIASNQAIALQPELSSEWIRGMDLGVNQLHRRIAEMSVPFNRARLKLLTLVVQLERILFFWISGGLQIAREELIDSMVDDWSLALNVRF